MRSTRQSMEHVAPIQGTAQHQHTKHTADNRIPEQLHTCTSTAAGILVSPTRQTRLHAYNQGAAQHQQANADNISKQLTRRNLCEVGASHAYKAYSSDPPSHKDTRASAVQYIVHLEFIASMPRSSQHATLPQTYLAKMPKKNVVVLLVAANVVIAVSVLRDENTERCLDGAMVAAVG